MDALSDGTKFCPVSTEVRGSFVCVCVGDYPWLPLTSHLHFPGIHLQPLFVTHLHPSPAEHGR